MPPLHHSQTTETARGMYRCFLMAPKWPMTMSMLRHLCGRALPGQRVFVAIEDRRPAICHGHADVIIRVRR